MPAPKKPVLKVLSDAHLRAIGMVAANWSRLEVTLIWALAKIGDVDFRKAVILAGPQNAISLCEMLDKLLAPQSIKDPKPTKNTEFSKIKERIQALQRDRNNIVHSYWFGPNTNKLVGLLGIELNQRPTADQKVSGTGIPKRGNKVFLDNAYTAKEMLSVAKQIDELDMTILKWAQMTMRTRALAKELKSGGKL